MKKLLIGIVAVALLGLMVVPAMADWSDTATVEVNITVEDYGAIEIPVPTLALTVSGPYVPGGDVYGGEIFFRVRCNVDTTLTVTATEPVSQAVFDPLQGFWFPTATCGDHKIGFGVRVGNLTTSDYGHWLHTTEADARAEVIFGPSQLGDDDLNASLYVESYMDSTRGGDALVPVGTYTTDLMLTLTP